MNNGSSQKQPILVKNNFEILNGLCGMLRDVILKLCRLFWHEKGKIQMVGSDSVSY
jgi:hypothetical protein